MLIEEDLVKKYLSKTSLNKRDFEKKLRELRNTVQFLTLLDEGFDIVKLAESPDFIIYNGSHFAGLEHELLVEPISKEIEGGVSSLFIQAESKFKQAYPELKYLLNISLEDKFKAPPKGKNSKYISIINSIIFSYIQTGFLEQNPIIEHIHFALHTELNFVPNLGAWMQKVLSPNIFNTALSKKEKHIEKYKLLSGIDEQWLLVVIRGLGGSSYEMNMGLPEMDFETSYTRVYILEAFTWKLRQIK